jgi:hypothetical protein
MTAFLLTCPYCNAQFSYTPPSSAPVRVPCPRCDDIFAWQPPAAEESLSAPRTGSRPGTLPRLPASDDQRVSAQPLAQPALLVPPLTLQRPMQRLPTARIVQLAGLSVAVALISLMLNVVVPSNTTEKALPFMLLLAGIGLVASLWLWFLQTPRSNAALAGFVLANMASVALLILPFLLSQTDFRRSHDPQKPPPEPPVAAQVTAVAPGELAGLGYLPVDHQLVAGIHVAELLRQPIGPKLFAKRKEGEPPPPWLIDQGFGRVARWTGLQPEQIDHVVFGLRLDGLLPHLTMVVRTRGPYDPQTLKTAQETLAAAQGKKVVPVKHLGHDYYKFADQPGNGNLWLADAQTLILVYRLDALTERDDLALTEKLRQGGEGPPPALRQILRSRLARGTLLWWCAIDQPQLAASMLGAKKEEELGKLLPNVRSVTGGLRLQKEEAAVLANFECADIATARRLAELLQQQNLPGVDKLTVEGPAPDGSDNWVLLQGRGQPEAVVRAVGRMQLLPGKGKG